MRQQLEEALMQKNTALQSVSKYISRERVFQQEIELLKRKIQDLTFGEYNDKIKCIINNAIILNNFREQSCG